MCTLVYSIHSHRKIAHLSHCKVIQRIPKESRRQFAGLEVAKARGYRLCNCCPAVAQRYHKERPTVDAYVRSMGLNFCLQDGAIDIISKHDSWRIITCGKNNLLFLYHKNKARRPFQESHPSAIPGYHSQGCRYDTIQGYLEYIVSHDRYRGIHPWRERLLPANSFSQQRENMRLSSDERETPEWFRDKYGAEHGDSPVPYQRPVKGTKRYRKEQAEKKRREIRAGIRRVYELLEEMAVTGY